MTEQDQSKEKKHEANKPKRRRTQRPFPASSFEEALDFARAILKFGSGNPVRKISLFDDLNKSPESGASRQVITNANKYGLIKGGYQAEQLELTQDGIRAVDEDISKREQARARIKLAIEDIKPFKDLYDRIVGGKLPQRAALVDYAKEADVPEEFANEAVDTFIVNLQFIGLLQTLSGAERVITIDHLLESLPSSNMHRSTADRSETGGFSEGDHSLRRSNLVTAEHAQFETTCFYITPIGEEESEERKHSDLFLGALVEPALEQSGLTVVRADAIDKPGTITRQVIEYILRSRLVIADLSYHNPNVFYELAIRHAARKPVVQLIRAADRIPFDLNQVRTVSINTSDIYSLVPRIDTYRSEIANQVRRALENPDAVDNPISTFYPDFRMASGGSE